MKDAISNWLTILKDKDVSDWMIVIVVNEDSRVKSKILRNSVFDRVKNDFCGRYPERLLLWRSLIVFIAC